MREPECSIEVGGSFYACVLKSNATGEYLVWMTRHRDDRSYLIGGFKFPFGCKPIEELKRFLFSNQYRLGIRYSIPLQTQAIWYDE